MRCNDLIERAGKRAADPIGSAAEKMAISAALLCFDELEVIDNADAMILGQLLEHLFARDVLCEAPLGSLDYQRTAHTYHTPMVDEIPVLGPEQRSKARRLITLIDVLYEAVLG